MTTNTQSITTTDFAEFQKKERVLAANLLNQWNKNGLPDDFYDEAVTIMMNKNSGNVFLTNEEYQVAMINPESEKLESWYSCPVCGYEGFACNMLHNDGRSGDFDAECCEYLVDIGVMPSDELDQLIQEEN